MSVKPKYQYHSFYPEGTLPEEIGAFYQDKFLGLLHMIDNIYQTCPELSQYPQAQVINLYDMILSVYRANLEKDLENFHSPDTYQETSKIIMRVVWNGQEPNVEVVDTFHSNPIETFTVPHQDIGSASFFVPPEYLDAIHASIASINRELNEYRYHFWEKGIQGFERFLNHSTHTERGDWKDEEGFQPVYHINNFATWDPNLTNQHNGKPGGAYDFGPASSSSLDHSFKRMKMHS